MASGASACVAMTHHPDPQSLLEENKMDLDSFVNIVELLGEETTTVLTKNPVPNGSNFSVIERRSMC